MARNLHFPFQIGSLGLPRTVDTAATIRQQIEQVLFTIPGERVGRPGFGVGVQRLVFQGATPELAAAVEHRIQQNLRKHLPTIRIDAARVRVVDVTLHIDILYTLPDTGQELAARFRAPLQGAP